MKRKNLLFKSLLVAAGLFVGVNTSWADATVIYERGTSETTAWSNDDVASSGTNVWIGQFGYNETYGLYASGTGARSSVLTFSHTDNSLQTFDIVFDNLGNTGNASNYSYLKIGNDIEIQSNQQNQNGAVIINGTSAAILDCNQKYYNRGGDKWTIHVEVNTAKNTVTALTIVGTEMNGKSAHYTLANETSLSGSATYDQVTIGFTRAGGTPSAALTSIKITEEEQTVTTADYTINYLYNNQIVKTVSGSSAVGSTVYAENPITIDEVKYFVADGETSSMEIGSGTNVLNVNLRLPNTYSYSVVAKDGSNNELATLASGSYTEGDAAITVAYPRWILSGTTLYSCGTGAISYKTTFTPDANDYVKTITYNSSTVDDVIFYTEGEDVVGVTEASNADRASMGKMGHTGGAEIYKDAATLAPGKYKIYMRAQNGNKDPRAFNFKVGETVVFTNSFNSGTNTDANSDEFIVNEASTLSFASEGSSASGIDYFYVVKLSDIVTFTLGTDVSYKSYIPTKAVNFSTLEDVVAYVATDYADGEVTLTPVEAVPAGTPVLLKSTKDKSVEIAGTTETVAAPEKNLLKATAAEGTVFDGTESKYVLSYHDAAWSFVHFNGTLPAGKVYVDLTEEAAGARPALVGIRFAGEETTGIADVQRSAGAQTYYDLNGQQVAQPSKGLYIVNGKKVIKK